MSGTVNTSHLTSNDQFVYSCLFGGGDHIEQLTTPENRTISNTGISAAVSSLENGSGLISFSDPRDHVEVPKVAKLFAEQTFYDEKAAIKEFKIVKDYVKEQITALEALLAIEKQILETFPMHGPAYVNKAEIMKEILMKDNSEEFNEKMLRYLLKSHTTSSKEFEKDVLAVIDESLQKAVSLTERYLCGSVQNFETDSNNNTLGSEVANEFYTIKAQELLSQAYTQLGWVQLRRIKILESFQTTTTDKDISRLASKRWELEQSASEYLRCGGVYGNAQAKMASARINPFAKLCGQMVETAMKGEFGDY